MDFSKPENARKINRLKVLYALRRQPCSRADLSRRLGINKVSISEIADSLIREGLIREGCKDTTKQGRPSTILSIAKEHGRAFSIEILPRKVTVSASNLEGQVLRFMQFPRTESIWDDVRRTIEKLSSNDVRNYGAAVITDEGLSIPEGILGFPFIIMPSAMAEAKAEMSHAYEELSSTLFLSWSDSIGAAYSENGTLHSLPTFAHMRVRNDGICTCGGTGCLEECAAISSLREKSGLDSRALLSASVKEPLAAIAFAITEAVQVLGVHNAMITGDMSQMKAENYAYLQERIASKLPPSRSDFIVFRSQCGEAAAREGGAIAALERFFYSSELLRMLDAIEMNSCGL